MTKEKNNEERKRIKEEYLDHKRTLLKMEEQNYRKLYLIRTYDGWYKLFGHSALFLSKHLHDKMGKTYNLNPDQDYGVRSSIGSVSIPAKKIDEFRLRAERGKLKLVREWTTGIEFDIGETLTEEDVTRMRHEDELMIAHANELVMPHAIMPELRARVREMAKNVHDAVTHQSKLSRTTFLNDFEIKAAEMNMMVIAVARGRIEIDECLEKLLELVEIMYEYATTMADYQMISPKKFFQMIKRIRAVEEQVKREMKNQALKRVEKEISKGKQRKDQNNDKNPKRSRTPSKDTRTGGSGDVVAGLPATKKETNK